jgi:Ca2+-binding RTX toxin-like protein
MTGGGGADYFEVVGTSAEQDGFVEPAIITDFTSVDSLLVRFGTQTPFTDFSLVPTADGLGTEVQINGTTYAVLEGATGVSMDQITFEPDRVLTESTTGTSGPDLLVGGLESVTLAGGGGNDVIIGGVESDSLYGGLGNDWISGSSDDPAASGGAADRIFGGFGNDTILAGDNDTVTGGAGSDVIELYGVGNDAIVTDFEPGVDRIVFTDPVNSSALALTARSGVGGSEILYNGVIIAQLEGVPLGAINLARDVSVVLER